MTKICLLQYNIHDPLMGDAGHIESYDPNDPDGNARDDTLHRMFYSTIAQIEMFRHGFMELRGKTVYSKLTILNREIPLFNIWYPSINLENSARPTKYRGIKRDMFAGFLRTINCVLRSYEMGEPLEDITVNRSIYSREAYAGEQNSAAIAWILEKSTEGFE